MSIRYELAVLTHGRASTLLRAVASFRDHVRPEPSRIRVFGDALDDPSTVVGALRGTFPHLEDPYVSATHPTRQQGFCRATARLWDAATRDTDVDYVFWLEHDFVLRRTVSLEQLASLLDQEPEIAQVALVRNPENEHEHRAGGLIASRPGSFALRRSEVQAEGVPWQVAWLEHRAFFTTNPSLMRRSFMVEQPFLDDGEPHCEGRYGAALVERGFRFAYWDDGAEYVEHVGERSGVGY